LSPSTLRPALRANIEWAWGVRDHVGESSLKFAVIQEVLIRELVREIADRALCSYEHKVLGLFHGERTPEHAVENAEDRSVRSDAEPKRQDRNQGEARRPQQHARCVANVLQQVFHKDHSLSRPSPDLLQTLCRRSTRAEG